MLSHTFNQRITLWKKSSHNQYGKGVYSLPIVFLGRVENGVASFSKVGSDVSVDTYVIYHEYAPAEVGDYIFIGESVSPTPEKAARVITSCSKIGSLSGSSTEYVIRV